jgi:pectate lyase
MTFYRFQLFVAFFLLITTIRCNGSSGESTQTDGGDDLSCQDGDGSPTDEAVDSETSPDPGGDDASDEAGDGVDEVSDGSDEADDSPDESRCGSPIPIEGFGAGTVGGWQPGCTVYHVTSLADDGPGSLRAGTQTGDAPTVVVFDVDGDIPLSGPIFLPSNISIDGRGRRVTLRGKGLYIPGSDEVIVTNIAITDVFPNTQDGITIGKPGNDPSVNIVIDHVAFDMTDENAGDSDNVDEAISVIFGSHNVTIAWCRFLRWEKVMLFGNGDTSVDIDGAITVTVHHNWAHATGRRHPKARYGLYDLYNNFWDDWRMFNYTIITDKRSFGVESQNGARILFENNIVRRNTHPYDAFSEANQVTRCESMGIIDERGTFTTPDSNAPLEYLVNCPTVFTPIERPYPATVDDADALLRSRLEWLETGNVL